MTLTWIILATLVGGVVSVLLASILAFKFLARFADRMVAFAVGVLLTYALTGILPEAAHLGLDVETMGCVLLAGLGGLFVLEKLALWRHDHAAAQGHATHQPEVAMIVFGDGMHNFVDGVLIAAAFLTDPALGWGTALAVMLHEIPQEFSDFMVLLNAGLTRRRALLLNVLSSAATTLGGVVGWLALDHAQQAIPTILALTAASFLYVAVADLIPELQRRRKLRDSVQQFLLMIAGIGVVFASSGAH